MGVQFPKKPGKECIAGDSLVFVASNPCLWAIHGIEAKQLDLYNSMFYAHYGN